jgi:hypothetical protein
MPNNKVYGYDIRDSYPSEKEYFKSNQKVGGMATEDGKIILNPYSELDERELNSVATNEAARLFIKENNLNFDFDITPEQAGSFKGTIYGEPENEQELKGTILGRIISGDKSAGNATQEQLDWAGKIKKALELRK